MAPVDVATATYPSSGVGPALGLERLWISFNGYWPERGARCPTGTFKDLEVAPSLARLDDHGSPGLLVASAGNTARAFAHLGGHGDVPIVVLVAERHLHRVWAPGVPHGPAATVVAVADADYNDVIEIAAAVAERTPLDVEGGVRNLARRDGIGSLLLHAADAIGELPGHYVQAVSGGPGPIGVFDMAERVVASGTYPGTLPVMHLAQNAEHCPVHRAWAAGRRHLEPGDVPGSTPAVHADVLVNRNPAYGIHGGLADVLMATGGSTYAVPAAEAEQAQELFADLEGIDIVPAAAVATAALAQAVRSGAIRPDETVLLCVSGGGHARLGTDMVLHPPMPTAVVPCADAAARVTELLDERVVVA